MIKHTRHQMGAIKMWAKRRGLTVEEYIAKRDSGFKRCMKCKEWKPIFEFPKDTSRGDGLHTKCFSCQRVKYPKKPVMPDWAKEKLRERNSKNKWHKGIPLSNEHKRMLREQMLISKRFTGDRNPNWKGRITPENHRERTSDKYKIWRNNVFKRDGFTCQSCGDNRGGNLHAHHIKNWSEFRSLRYDLNNGVTLCHHCHELTHDKPDSYRKRRKLKRISNKVAKGPLCAQPLVDYDHDDRLANV